MDGATLLDVDYCKHLLCCAFGCSCGHAADAPQSALTADPVVLLVPSLGLTLLPWQ